MPYSAVSRRFSYNISPSARASLPDNVIMTTRHPAPNLDTVHSALLGGRGSCSRLFLQFLLLSLQLDMYQTLHVSHLTVDARHAGQTYTGIAKGSRTHRPSPPLGRLGSSTAKTFGRWLALASVHSFVASPCRLRATRRWGVDESSDRIQDLLTGDGQYAILRET